jgi:beta-galactosidase
MSARSILIVMGTLLLGHPSRLAADTSFSLRWSFFKGDAGNTADASGWETVDIPHTWNVTDAADGGGKDMQSRDGYHRGPGWYRKIIRTDESLRGKRLFIRFEGASSVADVYLNGQPVGGHKGAFGAFCLELTKLLKIGADNELRVRVDNSWRSDLPPLSGDFPVFGGIYRPVSLLNKSQACISPLVLGSNGVRIRQQDVSRESAGVEISTSIDNAGEAADFEVECSLKDAEGAVVVRESSSLRAQGAAVVTQRMTLKNPRLWHGRSDPYLYSVEISLKQGGQVIDSQVEPLGLRFFKVDPQQGFFLNGEPYMIYGVNRHQDRAGKGWAVGSEDHAEDVRLIQETGARGVRLAHYPHAGEFYSLCDKAGLLVWAEVPNVDCISHDPAFAENAKTQLREMILQHGNHPSIFCWSLFNEMYHRPSAAFDPLLKELNTLAKEEDPTRFTAGATNKTDRVGLANITDLIAFNAYPGWYEGNPDGMTQVQEKYNRLGESRGIGVSEYGAGGSIRQHQQNPPKSVPTSRWHPEEWQAIVHEGNYRSIRDYAPCWGSFVWNMFDFASDWRDEGDAPGINDKGLVSYDRKTRKDAFFFYKANWSGEPVLYITSRRHVEREDAVTPVKIYSNAPSVKLRINGAEIGTKEVDDLKVARWDEVRLKPGNNTIEVEAVVNGRKLTDSCVWNLKTTAAGGSLPPDH